LGMITFKLKADLDKASVAAIPLIYNVLSWINRWSR
jgi:hypothetical protein